MADKQLNDSAWKAFAKGKGYKDAALLKALAAIDKADKGGPDAMLEALDDLDKQVAALRKEHKGDKELGAHLDKVEDAATRERKAAESARSKAASESLDDEEDSPALLTTKLVPLLKQVRKGDVVLQALIATSGKETAVLLSRKSISPARGKLLKEYLGVSGGIKFIKGECIFEANAHTFVVLSEAAGLAKKLKAALLAQTEMRVKVRVRGEDPDDVDDDGAEAEPADDAAAGGSPAATGPANTSPANASPAAADTARAAAAVEEAIQNWQTTRGSVVARFRELAHDAVQEQFPESRDVVVAVMAVVKQLSVEPRTPQQVRELIRWVRDDDVVSDVSEFDEDIQTPLLAALNRISTALDEQGAR